MAPLHFEAQISQALANNTIPGAVLLAKSKDGRVNYRKNIGPWDATTTIFPLMSMSKLLTSIAAAQAIEQGLITLDTDVTTLLPSLAAQPILTGFDAGGRPQLKKRQKAITFRHLLTHSYGQTYNFMDTEVTGRYLASEGKAAHFPDGHHSVEETFNFPLLSEPGEAWLYGPGLDWAGRAIEKVSGVPLEEFMQRHIFAPLGIKDISFFPARRPGMVERKAAISVRDELTGKSVPAPPGEGGVDPTLIRYCLGGSGLFASMEDYLKVVESILVDDEKLLKKETAQMLFEPQLGIEGKDQDVMIESLQDLDWAVGWTPKSGENYMWSLAGLLTQARNGHRRKGFLQWGGMYNSAWFIDREAGLTALFGTCFMPSADAKIEELVKVYELGLYELLDA